MSIDDNGISNFRELMGFSTKRDQVMYEDEDYNEEVPNVQKITKKNGILPLWNNQTTMNLNNLVLENIVQSSYYKNYLNEVVTFQQAADEIIYNVSHLEPWEKGSRRAPGTGMCGSVRGVAIGGVISTAFCVLYKMFTLRLTRKQLVSMINSTQSVYLRGVGFLYIRFCQPPTDLLAWYEPYFDDTEEIDPRSGGGDQTTIGMMLKQILTKLDWYGTLFPRVPFSVQKEIESRFGDKSQPVRSERRRVRSPPAARLEQPSSSIQRKRRCKHHLRHHHCRKHRQKCPSKAKKQKTTDLKADL